MNLRTMRQSFRIAGRLSLSFAILACAWGQSQKVDVKKAKVVYASGNDLVVKSTDGKVKHFVIPKDYKFNIGGQQTATKDLKVGTELTQTITTTTTDRTITKVQNIKGKVWEVNPPSTIIVTTDSGNKRFRVPDNTKFDIAGQQKTAFELKPGMDIDATIVTSTPETDVSQKAVVVGKAPPPETPDLVGVLLIEEIDIVKK